MKPRILSAILTGICFSSQCFAANTQSVPSGTLSSTNQTAASTSSSAVFTNSSGQTFTADQLAENLKNLRAAIEQTIPMITAISETYSNSAGRDKSWTGRLSEFVSGALSKEGQGTNQSSSRLNEVVGTVRGFFGSKTNASTVSTAADDTTMQKLVTLENQLKPVVPTLDQLNVASAASGSQVISSPKPLTPTGR
jgi:hypothetical protein